MTAGWIMCLISLPTVCYMYNIFNQLASFQLFL